MLIWRGWGILTLVIVGLGVGFGYLVAQVFGVEVTGNNPFTAAGLLLAAIALWFIGAKLNAPREGFDPNTGQKVMHRNMHTLMFIPMQWFGPLVGAGSVVMFVNPG
jgi:uncharacterized membrane protein YccF (DUF307 family)